MKNFKTQSHITREEYLGSFRNIEHFNQKLLEIQEEHVKSRSEEYQDNPEIEWSSISIWLDTGVDEYDLTHHIPLLMMKSFRKIELNPEEVLDKSIREEKIKINNEKIHQLYSEIEKLRNE